jgi:hypothetical protein
LLRDQDNAREGKSAEHKSAGQVDQASFHGMPFHGISSAKPPILSCWFGRGPGVILQIPAIV